jgi:hypothetical protein
MAGSASLSLKAADVDASVYRGRADLILAHLDQPNDGPPIRDPHIPITNGT